MADLRLVFAAVTGQFDAAFRAIYDPVAAAATGAIKDAATQIKTEGRANIAAAGFSSKWQNALRVEVYPARGVSANAAALAHHNISYSGVFETGADIKGKPLLWIPLSDSPARIAGARLTPSRFRQQIGPLVLIHNRKGQPFLASPITGRAGTKITVPKLRRGQRGDGGRLGVRLQPIFVGVPAVHINQHFGLIPIIERAAAGLADGYARNFNAP